MRKLEPPDWAYFRASWGIFIFGAGLMALASDSFMGSDTAHLAGLALMALGLLLLLYSLRPTLQSVAVSRRHSIPQEPTTLTDLQITASIRPAEQLFDLSDSDRSYLYVMDPKFAVLEVRNAGERRINSLVALVYYDAEAPEDGLWTTRLGRKRLKKEVAVAPPDIPPEATRVLLLAITYKQQANWYRVIPEMLLKDSFTPREFPAKLQSMMGLHLGSRIKLRVRLATDGAKWVYDVVLGFDTSRHAHADAILVKTP